MVTPKNNNQETRTLRKWVIAFLFFWILCFFISALAIISIIVYIIFVQTGTLPAPLNTLYLGVNTLAILLILSAISSLACTLPLYLSPSPSQASPPTTTKRLALQRRCRLLCLYCVGCIISSLILGYILQKSNKNIIDLSHLYIEQEQTEEDEYMPDEDDSSLDLDDLDTL